MGSDRKVPQKRISDEAKQLATVYSSSELERKIFDIPLYKKDGTRESPHAKNPYVVLKYFQSEWECFSNWEKEELRQFSSFLSTFSEKTWGDVYKSAGKGPNKAGLAYTPYELSTMKSGEETLKKVRNKISDDIGFFELRVSKKIRVHGFQSQAAFFLVLLDREHRVFPE